MPSFSDLWGEMETDKRVGEGLSECRARALSTERSTMYGWKKKQFRRQSRVVEGGAAVMHDPQFFKVL